MQLWIAYKNEIEDWLRVVEWENDEWKSMDITGMFNLVTLGHLVRAQTSKTYITYLNVQEITHGHSLYIISLKKSMVIVKFTYVSTQKIFKM